MPLAGYMSTNIRGVPLTVAEPIRVEEEPIRVDVIVSQVQRQESILTQAPTGTHRQYAGYDWNDTGNKYGWGTNTLQAADNALTLNQAGGQGGAVPVNTNANGPWGTVYAGNIPTIDLNGNYTPSAYRSNIKLHNNYVQAMAFAGSETYTCIKKTNYYTGQVYSSELVVRRDTEDIQYFASTTGVNDAILTTSGVSNWLTKNQLPLDTIHKYISSPGTNTGYTQDPTPNLSCYFCSCPHVNTLDPCESTTTNNAITVTCPSIQGHTNIAQLQFSRTITSTVAASNHTNNLPHNLDNWSGSTIQVQPQNYTSTSNATYTVNNITWGNQDGTTASNTIESTQGNKKLIPPLLLGCKQTIPLRSSIETTLPQYDPNDEKSKPDYIANINKGMGDINTTVSGYANQPIFTVPISIPLELRQSLDPGATYTIRLNILATDGVTTQNGSKLIPIPSTDTIYVGIPYPRTPNSGNGYGGYLPTIELISIDILEDTLLVVRTLTNCGRTRGEVCPANTVTDVTMCITNTHKCLQDGGTLKNGICCLPSNNPKFDPTTQTYCNDTCHTFPNQVMVVDQTTNTPTCVCLPTTEEIQYDKNGTLVVQCQYPCPAGTSRNLTTNFCESLCPYPQSWSPILAKCVTACPTTHVLANDGKCCPIQRTSNALDCICPPGTTLWGNLCLPACPIGYIYNSKGMCIKDNSNGIQVIYEDHTLTIQLP